MHVSCLCPLLAIQYISLPCTQNQISLVINITAVYPPLRCDSYSCASPLFESTTSLSLPAMHPLPIAKYQTRKSSQHSDPLAEAPSHPTPDSRTPTPNPNPGSGQTPRQCVTTRHTASPVFAAPASPASPATPAPFSIWLLEYILLMETSQVLPVCQSINRREQAMSQLTRFTTDIPWVQFSDTVPLPINTVTIVGEGMTPYMFGYGVIPKKLNCYAAHHCVSLTVSQVVFLQVVGDAALCCAEQAFLSCPVLSPS